MGDNYAQQGNLFVESEIRINIFNIAKFNSDNKGQKKDGISLAPKIKRLSEYLGQSYWDYLSNLDDLVILMDEAHRYHADASKNAINELKPVLGIELTATPFDEKGKPFKNVVYEY
jgi:type III restriction enzyme